MTDKEKKRFIYFLKLYGIYDLFNLELEKHLNIRVGRLLLIIPYPIYCISGAFDFENTINGSSFWNDTNYLWLECLKNQ